MTDDFDSLQQGVQKLRSRLSKQKVLDRAGDYVLDALHNGTRREQMWAANMVFELAVKPTSKKCSRAEIRNLITRLNNALEEDEL